MKMAVVTKGNDGKEPMADDDDRSDKRDDREEREEREAEQREEREAAARGPAPAQGVGGGWFSLYKPGQGYWTRMGTAAGVVLLIAFMASFIYEKLATRTQLDWHLNPAKGITEQGFPKIKLIITGSFCLISAIVAWYYLNKPKIVDFYIATESEMKKVNWTSRKEIVGSTKVVISFMFIVAIFLFVVDLFFAWLFYLIKVLHKAPFT